MDVDQVWEWRVDKFREHVAYLQYVDKTLKERARGKESEGGPTAEGKKPPPRTMSGSPRRGK